MKEITVKEKVELNRYMMIEKIRNNIANNGYASCYLTSEIRYIVPEAMNRKLLEYIKNRKF